MKERLTAYIRILRVAKKPNMYEFKTILKITGLGIILIGLIGFGIRMIASFIG